MLILFVTATKLTTAANAIFLQSTAPLYVLLLGPLLLKERAKRSDLAFAAVVGLAFQCSSSPGKPLWPPRPTRCAGTSWALSPALRGRLP